MANTHKKRILSGMRPTGKLHLGNLVGALANWVKLQHEYESFHFVADWHMVTTDYPDPSGVRENTWEIVADWLAAGLDPKFATMFVQSRLPEHAELHLLFSMTRAALVAVLFTLRLALVAGAVNAAEPPKPETPVDLDKLAGQPVDLSPWAYAWRADREVQEKPEAYFIPRQLERLDKVYRTIESQRAETDQDRRRVDEYKSMGLLPAPKGRLLSGLLWLAPVPAQRIELRWPEGSALPPVEAIEVRVYPAKAGWFGAVRDEVLPAPAASADGRTLTYPRSKSTLEGTDMVAVFFDPGKATAGAKYGCPTIHLFPPNRKWIALDVEIEWSFKEWDRAAPGSA